MTLPDTLTSITLPKMKCHLAIAGTTVLLATHVGAAVGLWDYSQTMLEGSSHTSATSFPLTSGGSSPVTMIVSSIFSRNYATDYENGFNGGFSPDIGGGGLTSSYAVIPHPEREGITTRWSETMTIALDQPIDFGDPGGQSAANQSGFLLFESRPFSPSIYPGASITFTLTGGGVFTELGSSQSFMDYQFSGIGTDTVTVTWNTTPPLDEIGYRAATFDNIKISGTVSSIRIRQEFSADSQELYVGGSHLEIQSNGAATVPEPVGASLAGIAGMMTLLGRRRGVC